MENDVPKDILLSQEQRDTIQKARDTKKYLLERAGESFVENKQLEVDIARETLTQQDLIKKKLKYELLCAKSITKKKDAQAETEYERAIEITGVIPEISDNDPVTGLPRLPRFKYP